MDMNSDLLWSRPASLSSQPHPLIFHHLFCLTQDHPSQAPSASSPLLPTTFTSLTPPSFQPQSPHPPIPLNRHLLSSYKRQETEAV